MQSNGIQIYLPGALAALLALAAGAAPALAQEHGDADAEQGSGWKTALELTMTDASGNQEFSVLTTAVTIEHQNPDAFESRLHLQARRGSSDGEQVAESYKGTFTFDVGPGGRWAPFVYTKAEHDPFKRLDVRVNSGAGAKYHVYRKRDRGAADLSLAVLHSYEALSPEAALEPTRSARWSLRLNGFQAVSDDVTLSHHTHFEPVADALGDYLLTLETGLKVLINSHIALSVSHEFNRDTTPAADVGKDDRLLKAGVLVEL